MNIARNYLVEKQFKNNGLKKGEVEIKDSAITGLIRYYTREAGVRGLEREIAKLCRKVVKELALADKKDLPVIIEEAQLEHYSGVRKHNFGIAEEQDQVGLVTGLAWTQVGGDILSNRNSSGSGQRPSGNYR